MLNWAWQADCVTCCYSCRAGLAAFLQLSLNKKWKPFVFSCSILRAYVWFECGMCTWSSVYACVRSEVNVGHLSLAFSILWRQGLRLSLNLSNLASEEVLLSPPPQCLRVTDIPPGPVFVVGI